MPNSSITDTLTEYSASLSYADLPDRVVFRAKSVLLDELGCMILGRMLDPGRISEQYVRTFEGRSEATVVGTALRAPVPLAALANGTADHADELDGSHITEGHPGATIVSACLALGEYGDASGKDLITALVVGYDIGTRLVEAAGGRFKLLAERHLHSDFLHAFGAALGGARLVGLEPSRFCHAAALTACQAVSVGAFFAERRHLSKSFTYGHLAHSATSSVLLAQMGMEGNDDVFDAEHGIINAWCDPARADESTARLGEYFAIVDSNFKFYSAGYPIHTPIEGALSLMQEHQLVIDDIESIRVSMNTNCATTVDQREMPSISLQDMLPIAMVYGKLGFQEAHNQENLHLPDVARLRDAMELEIDPEMDRTTPRGRGAGVSLTLRDGREVQRTVDWPYGHAYRGDVTADELAEKSHSMLDDIIGSETVDDLVAAVMELDRSDNLSALTRTLALETMQR